MSSPKVYFKVEKVADENTGQEIDSLVQYKETEGKDPVKDVWCSVVDLDRLFNACVDRWDSNWNLEKVCVAIRESEID
jgi:hypothetical protein